MLPSVRATINGKTLTLEVANRPATRRKGLSGRHVIPLGSGMLFVFPQQGFHSFWMKDTYVPLSIYWLDATGRVMAQDTMLPGDLRSHVPSDPASLAVEVPLAWGAQNRVRIGDRFTFSR
jgi:uncharacterized membrane protein (UPF0127 family)